MFRLIIIKTKQQIFEVIYLRNLAMKSKKITFEILKKKFISKVIPLKWRLKSSPESRKPTKEENRSVNHYQIKPDTANDKFVQLLYSCFI